ncbi:hypothetical protein SDC9_110390 [bioreactor metagenome]|uniref:Uncharacterized protein n=1 Tax=bioreactor metagenome TaxID=1076179 RepID=A0A645BDH1_9ZZZZ
MLADVLVGDGDRRVADERRPAGEQLVEQAAGGVQVGPEADLLAAGPFGGEVLGGPDHRGGLGHRRLGVGDGPGDAEVHHLHRAGGVGEHHVARLDVAVHDPGPVRVAQRIEHALGDLQGPLGGERLTGVHHLAERTTLDQLHHDVGHDLARDRVTFLVGVVDGDDVGVVEPGRGVRLAAEPRLEGRVGGQVDAQPLDRHVALQAQVAGPVDLCHAASAQRGAELIAATEDHGLGVHSQLTFRAHRSAWITLLAIGAATTLPPTSDRGTLADSTKTATAILRLFFSAKHVNQAYGGLSVVVWAVPVLPPTVTPLIWALVPVPLLTTLTIIPCSFWAFWALMAWDSSLGLVVLSAVRSAARTVCTTYGVITLPSLAMPAETIAMCSGLEATSYWPMPLSPVCAGSSFDGKRAATPFTSVSR